MVLQIVHQDTAVPSMDIAELAKTFVVKTASKDFRELEHAAVCFQLLLQEGNAEQVLGSALHLSAVLNTGTVALAKVIVVMVVSQLLGAVEVVPCPLQSLEAAVELVLRYAHLISAVLSMGIAESLMISAVMVVKMSLARAVPLRPSLLSVNKLRCRRQHQVEIAARRLPYVQLPNAALNLDIVV
jgi:hypothetical protein